MYQKAPKFKSLGAFWFQRIVKACVVCWLASCLFCKWSRVYKWSRIWL